MESKIWNRIFKALSKDISDRRGLKWEWTKIDPEVIKEISAAWKLIFEKEAEADNARLAADLAASRGNEARLAAAILEHEGHGEFAHAEHGRYGCVDVLVGALSGSTSALEERLAEARRAERIDFQAGGIDAVASVLLEALNKIPNDGPGSHFRREVLPVVQTMQRKAAALRSGVKGDQAE